MRNICARFAQDCTYFSNAQYMHKICPRLYLFSPMHKICGRLYFFPQCAIYVQDLHKILHISPMRNICARFVQDCTSFPNAQCMRKICVRLYFFPQCARLYLFLQCARVYLFLQCAIYVQDLCKIVLLSPTHNICARLYLTSNLKC